jgi:peptidoglycan/xylan/chitin deacetylase (PgdA/CDA1 family)
MRAGNLRLIVPLALASVLLAAGGVRYWQTGDFDLSGTGCVVLAYHRIVDRPAFPMAVWKRLDDYTLYRDDFQKQIQSLKASGVHFITPQQLEKIVKNQMKPDGKSVLVTLDDGDISQYRNVFPILRQEQVPFALFVISGHAGDRSYENLEMASWKQIREMAQSGLATIGSHSNDMHTVDPYGDLCS